MYSIKAELRFSARPCNQACNFMGAELLNKHALIKICYSQESSPVRHCPQSNIPAS